MCRRDPRDTHQNTKNDLAFQQVDTDARLGNSERLVDDIHELTGSEQCAGI